MAVPFVEFMAVFLILLTVAGCNPEGPGHGEPPFTCAAGDCPDGACKVRINFASDCKESLGNVEILIDGRLEPEVASFGATFQSEGDIPVGTTAQIFVRAEDWQWPLELECNDPTEDQTFPLSCASNSAE